MTTRQFMKNVTLFVLGCLAGVGIYVVIGMGSDNTSGTTATHSERKPLYWVAPMDPSYRSDKPGKSPMGMDLIPVYEEDAQASGIKIDNVEAHNLALKTAKAEKMPVVLTTRTFGRVAYDEDLRTHVHTRVNGWVEALYVKAQGERVEQGQKLFSLYSPEWVNAQQEYLTALKSGESTLIKASRDRLRYLGLTEQQIETLKKTRQIQDRLVIKAPQEGYVEHIGIGEGEFVTPKTVIMSLVGLKQVWVIVDVFESDAGLVAPDMPAEVMVEAFPTRKWLGRIEHIYPQLNIRSRTLPVRIVVDNPDERLRAGMLATAVFSKDIGERLVVPKSAVIRGRIDRVITRVDDSHFDVAVVKTGVETDKYVEIVEGLDAGDVVVTSSQFLIDSESNLDEALKRFQQQKAAIQPVFGQGVVRSVDVQNHQITLAHEPIEVLGWPAMTMDFDVSDNIELSVDLVGKTIHFALRKHEERYVIEQIHVMDTPDLQPAESADHEMKQHTEHKHEHADSGHEHGGHQHD